MRPALRVISALFSALLGIALCLALIRSDEALGLLPDLPTPGGEDDFSVRAAGFFGLVCPIFAALGAYLGWLSLDETARALRAWAGAAAGSIASFGLAAVCPSALSWLARTSLRGNGAFLVFLATWVLLAVSLALWFGKRRR